MGTVIRSWLTLDLATLINLATSLNLAMAVPKFSNAYQIHISGRFHALFNTYIIRNSWILVKTNTGLTIDQDNLESRLYGFPNCRYKQKNRVISRYSLNKLDSQRIYDVGYRSVASFWCRKYPGKHSATFKWLYILTFHYIHETLRTPLGVPKIFNGGPITVDNFRDASN